LSFQEFKPLGTFQEVSSRAADAELLKEAGFNHGLHGLHGLHRYRKGEEEENIRVIHLIRVIRGQSVSNTGTFQKEFLS